MDLEARELLAAAESCWRLRSSFRGQDKGILSQRRPLRRSVEGGLGSVGSPQAPQASSTDLLRGRR